VRALRMQHHERGQELKRRAHIEMSILEIVNNAPAACSINILAEKVLHTITNEIPARKVNHLYGAEEMIIEKRL
jgi:hypothetical protein